MHMHAGLGQTIYELSIVTSGEEDDGLSPSATEIAIQLTGDAASSQEILCRSPNRESVCPGATLKLLHERRAAEAPFGELVRPPVSVGDHCALRSKDAGDPPSLCVVRVWVCLLPTPQA